MGGAWAEGRCDSLWGTLHNRPLDWRSPCVDIPLPKQTGPFASIQRASKHWGKRETIFVRGWARCSPSAPKLFLTEWSGLLPSGALHVWEHLCDIPQSHRTEMGCELRFEGVEACKGEGEGQPRPWRSWVRSCRKDANCGAALVWFLQRLFPVFSKF